MISDSTSSRRPVPGAAGLTFDPARYPTLAAAAGYSRQVQGRLIAALERERPHLDTIATVAVGGSLGRLEAHSKSDIDGLVIGIEGAPAPTFRAQSHRVSTLLAGSELKPPKSGGIYLEGVDVGVLLAPGAQGSLAEAPQVFGFRIGLLLDAQPLYMPGACRRLQRDILCWYGQGFHDRDPCASWTLLINDVQRYLHAYAGWQQYKFDRGADDGWLLRQAKLRSSRVLSFAAMLCVLGETNDLADKHERVLAFLRLTPLERLHAIMTHYDAPQFAALLDSYEAVLAALSDADTRRALVNHSPTSAATLDASAAGAEVQQHGARIMQILTAFILARQADWDPRFFVRLVL